MIRSILALAATLFTLSATAQIPTSQITLNSECGAKGIGMRKTDNVVVESLQQNERVNAQGYWEKCNVQPAPSTRACGGDQRFVEWTVGANSCTTYDKYASVATDPKRFQGLFHGQGKVYSQWQGPMRGDIALKCNDGKVETVMATCAPATGCEALYQVQVKKVWYSYDSRATPVLNGSTVQAVSADGKKIPVKCVNGTFQ